MKEIWKPVLGYEEAYLVSNLGKIKSLKWGNERILKPGVGGRLNYLKVILYNNNKKLNKYIHIAVWEAFNGPIPEGYDVHHKNGDTFDNQLKNFELIESKKHVSKHQSIPVMQFDKEGNFIKEWSSMIEVERQLGIAHNSIAKCCLGRYGRKTAGGFTWKYKKEKPEIL